MNFDTVLTDKIGNGQLQQQLFYVSALIWMGGGSQALVLGLLLPKLNTEWPYDGNNLTRGNILISVTFIGWIIGSLAVGKISDQHGRGEPLKISALFTFVVAIASAFTTSFNQFMISRFFYGICNGFTAPLISTLIAQLNIPSLRSQQLTHIANFFALGQLYPAFLIYFMFSDFLTGNWRLLLILATLPNLIGVITCYYYNIQSPRYLLISGRVNEGLELTKAYIKLNGLVKQQKNYITVEEEYQLQNWAQREAQKYKIVNSFDNIKELFNDRNYLITVKIIGFWTIFGLIKFGLTLSLPSILIKLGVKTVQKSFHESVVTIILTVLAEIPSNYCARFLSEHPKLGRRNSLILCTLVTSFIGFGGFTFLKSQIFFLSVLLQFSNNVSWIIIYIFTPEVYDTLIRSTGFGFTNSFARVGAGLSPWIIQLFFNISDTGPFLAFSIFSLFATFIAVSISKDTRGIPLDSYTELENFTLKSQLISQKKNLLS